MQLDNLKPLVNSPHWRDFIKYVEELSDRDVTNITSCKEDAEIHRYQGALAVYKQLLNLKDRVNG